jgi:serine/threonine protein kinase
MPAIVSYNPTYTDEATGINYNAQNRALSNQQLVDLAQEIQQLKTSTDAYHHEINLSGSELTLFKDTEGNIYCQIPGTTKKSGTYGDVSFCQNINNGQIYALKHQKDGGLEDEVMKSNHLYELGIYPSKAYVIPATIEPSDDADSYAVLPFFSGADLTSYYINEPVQDNLITDVLQEDLTGEIKRTESEDPLDDRDGEKENIKIPDNISETEKTRKRSGTFVETDDEPGKVLVNLEELATSDATRFMPQFAVEARGYEANMSVKELQARISSQMQNATNIKNRANALYRKSDSHENARLAKEEVFRRTQTGLLVAVDNNLLLQFLAEMCIVSELAISALKRLHDNGILHLDVKSENIIIDLVNRTSYMCDLGTTRIDRYDVKKDGENLVFRTINPQTIGSPYCMAPEIRECWRKMAASNRVFSMQRNLETYVDQLRNKIGQPLPCFNIKVKNQEMHITEDMTIRDIMGAVYTEPAEFAYTNQAEVYSIGASLGFVLASMLQKLVKITGEYALLPERFANPEAKKSIDLANQALTIIQNLTKEDPEARISLDESLIQFKHLAQQIKQTIEDEQQAKSESKQPKLAHLAAASTVQQVSVAAELGSPVIQFISECHMVSDNSWGQIKLAVEDVTKRISAKHALPRISKSHISNLGMHFHESLGDRFNAKLTSGGNVMEITENIPGKIPREKLIIKKADGIISFVIPGAWLEQTDKNDPYRKLIYSLINGVVPAADFSKAIIGNCRGQPETAKNLSLLIKQKNNKVRTAYSHDGTSAHIAAMKLGKKLIPRSRA